VRAGSERDKQVYAMSNIRQTNKESSPEANSQFAFSKYGGSSEFSVSDFGKEREEES
jgi:hypothetical protein